MNAKCRCGLHVLVGLMTALMLAMSCTAQIPVVPDWSADEASNTGFFDNAASPVAGHASIGALRRAIFYAAANYVGSLFKPSHPEEVIQVQASFANLGPGVIGYGGPLGYMNNFGSSHPQYNPDTDYAWALANHIAGQTLAPGNTLQLILNSHTSIPFHYSTNNTPPPNTGVENLFVTMVHEMIHGLGFVNEIHPVSGAYPGHPAIYDRFLAQGSTAPVPLITMSDAARAAAVKSNNLFWNGVNATAMNSGSLVKLFAPASHHAASSVFHVDTTVFDPRGLAMLPSGSPLVASQIALIGLERAMLHDMGWTPSLPRITSISRAGDQTTITFNGLLNGVYQLKHSPDLMQSGSVKDWAIGANRTTNGWGAGTLMHSTINSKGFYAVEAAP